MSKRFEIAVQPDFLERQAKAQPLNAIAELIWNALDADATKINVYFDYDTIGLVTVRVVDNGHGIPYEEAPQLFELTGHFERRREELQQERNCTISDIRRHGRAWVLPHPDRTAPAIAPMVRDDDIERIAVQKAIEYEQARGWTVQSVEKENRGFDLISHRSSVQDPLIASEIRFIEVKGRAGIGEIALTGNEYKTAERLRGDYWLYVVYDCGTKPAIHPIKDPVRLGWEPLVRIEHYHVDAKTILHSEER